MLSKREIKDIQSLSDKKARQQSGLYLAEGPKLVAELCQEDGVEIEKIFATKEGLEEEPVLAGFEGTVEISQQELERISQLKTANKVVGVFKQSESRRPEASGWMLYLDRIQDPGNFGTIIRTADWFGIENIVCSEGCADVYNPKVVQATMASIARVNVYYEKETEWLKSIQLPMIAATLDGQPLHSMEKLSEGVILIGNEAQGLKKDLISKSTHQVTISGKGKAESLNAAVATAIILHHFSS